MRQAKTRPRRLRYTKAALLAYGFGVVLGFVVVVGEVTGLERVASLLMATAIVSLPVTLFADGHGMALVGRIAAKLARGRHRTAGRKSRPTATRRRTAAAKRTRRRRS